MLVSHEKKVNSFVLGLLHNVITDKYKSLVKIKRSGSIYHITSVMLVTLSWQSFTLKMLLAVWIFFYIGEKSKEH